MLLLCSRHSGAGEHRSVVAMFPWRLGHSLLFPTQLPPTNLFDEPATGAELAGLTNGGGNADGDDFGPPYT